MKALLRLIPSLASDEIGVRVASAKRRAIFITLIIVCCLVAVGFGLGALMVWLASLYGALDACLIVAGGFLIVAVVALIVMKIADSRARRKARRRREANRALYLAAIAAAPSGLRSKSVLAVALPLAMIAGFVLAGAARKPGDK